MAGSTPPVERVIETTRLRVMVRDHPGRLPGVLALHGLASNARWWDLVARRLGQRLVAWDARGHGGSDHPATGYGFEDVTADASALLDSLELDRVVVVGHSWGAWVALHLAAAEPDRVAGVVCVDGAAADLRARLGDDWATAAQAMRPPDLDGVGRAEVEGWVGRGTLAEGSDAETATAILLGNFEVFGEDRLRPHLRVASHMAIAEALWAEPTAAVVAAVRQPVAFLLADPGGRAGEARRAEVEGLLAGAGRRADVTWVRGSHDLPVQRPVETARGIARMVATVTAR